MANAQTLNINLTRHVLVRAKAEILHLVSCSCFDIIFCKIWANFCSVLFSYLNEDVAIRITNSRGHERHWNNFVKNNKTLFRSSCWLRATEPTWSTSSSMWWTLFFIASTTTISRPSPCRNFSRRSVSSRRSPIVLRPGGLPSEQERVCG